MICSLLDLPAIDIVRRLFHRLSRSRGSDFSLCNLSPLPSQRCVSELVASLALFDYVCRILQARVTRSAAEKEAPRRRIVKDKRT